ncbi:hypothetical protein BCR36DRAFT_89579 [Piromyces finnis]|uniref:Uncharacterized protein n=1 Tax=Piromyces finnis TaxID=1754191 RepID=A0A1Y1VLR0_9FUNG|nr:hypothetical protein BCR36DRAFT_89579 [Piromyces finnis]|eukprot:ORX59223.1 hypothetical protein BCR36DRAFT_89579 [Piromyces finnis]
MYLTFCYNPPQFSNSLSFFLKHWNFQIYYFITELFFFLVSFYFHFILYKIQINEIKNRSRID